MEDNNNLNDVGLYWQEENIDYYYTINMYCIVYIKPIFSIY